MKKLLKIISAILFLPLILTGCWNYKDINVRSINLCIGVDDKDGEIEYGGEFAKLNTNEIEKGQAELTDVYNFKSSGDSFEVTRMTYDNRTTGLDFSGALRAVVFTKKYAQNIGIESYMNRLNYVNQFRNSVLVTISDESLETLFNNPVENDISVGYSIENTISNLSDGGFTLYRSAQHIISDIRFENIGYLVPYITRANGTIKYLGFAVMKDSKMIGVIPAKESDGVLFLLSEKPNTTILIPHPQDKNNLVNVKVFLNKRNINTSYENNHVTIDVNLSLISEILYEYKMNPISDEDIKMLQDYISSTIKNEITSAVTNSKKEFKCDIFEFARHFKASNYTYYKKIDWSKEYENADVNVNVKTIIKHSNVLDPNAKVPTTKK